MKADTFLERGGVRWQMKVVSANTKRRQRRHVAAQWKRPTVIAESIEKTMGRDSSLSDNLSSCLSAAAHGLR